MCRYNHTICVDIKTAGGGGGVGIVPIKQINGKQYAILPVERFGNYANQYNICSGSLDDEDLGCYLRGMERELREELKIKLVEPRYIDMIGVLLKNKIHWFLHRNTPIFIINTEYNLNTINNQIYLDNNNVHLPICFKEIKYADYMDITTGTPVHYHGVLSSFATAVLEKLQIYLKHD